MQNNVRKFRRELELSQDKLAELAGTSRQTIIAIEKGKRDEVISLGLAFRIANALGKKITDIFLPNDVAHEERGPKAS